MNAELSFRHLVMCRLRTSYLQPFFDDEATRPWFYPIDREGFSTLAAFEGRIYINTPFIFWVEMQRAEVTGS